MIWWGTTYISLPPVKTHWWSASVVTSRLHRFRSCSSKFLLTEPPVSTTWIGNAKMPASSWVYSKRMRRWWFIYLSPRLGIRARLNSCMLWRRICRTLQTKDRIWWAWCPNITSSSTCRKYVASSSSGRRTRMFALSRKSQEQGRRIKKSNVRQLFHVNAVPQPDLGTNANMVPDRSILTEQSDGKIPSQSRTVTFRPYSTSALRYSVVYCSGSLSFTHPPITIQSEFSVTAPPLLPSSQHCTETLWILRTRGSTMNTDVTNTDTSTQHSTLGVIDETVARGADRFRRGHELTSSMFTYGLRHAVDEDCALFPFWTFLERKRGSNQRV